MNHFKILARALRARQTSAEDILWRELRSRRLAGFKFRRQHPVARYIVDFVSLDAKLIIEVDGATHSTEAERAHDNERSSELELVGFHVMRVTNAEIYENLGGVL
jgi:very-short-patch-repair endonuclease